MKHKSKFLALDLGIMLLLFFCGCSEPQKTETKVLLPLKPRGVSVKMNLPKEGEGLERVNDRNNLQDVISFAIRLGDLGKHKEAAEVYIDASERFDSMDGRLRQDLLKAAIYEAWLSGEPATCRQYFGRLSRYQKDVYDRLEVNETLWEIHRIVYEN